MASQYAGGKGRAAVSGLRWDMWAGEGRRAKEGSVGDPTRSGGINRTSRCCPAPELRPLHRCGRAPLDARFDCRSDAVLDRRTHCHLSQRLTLLLQRRRTCRRRHLEPIFAASTGRHRRRNLGRGHSHSGSFCLLLLLLLLLPAARVCSTLSRESLEQFLVPAGPCRGHRCPAGFLVPPPCCRHLRLKATQRRRTIRGLWVRMLTPAGWRAAGVMVGTRAMANLSITSAVSSRSPWAASSCLSCAANRAASARACRS